MRANPRRAALARNDRGSVHAARRAHAIGELLELGGFRARLIVAVANFVDRRRRSGEMGRLGEIFCVRLHDVGSLDVRAVARWLRKRSSNAHAIHRFNH